MAYFRKLTNHLEELQSLFSQNDTWLILINADPDALGSAMALMRLMRNKVRKVEIAQVNEITRPDNLAMIRYLRIPLSFWKPKNIDVPLNTMNIMDTIDTMNTVDTAGMIDTMNTVNTVGTPKAKGTHAKSMANSIKLDKFDKFAIVDSQPHHHPSFAGIDFSIIIDHHPLPEGGGVVAPFMEVRPNYGSTCTMFVELLYNAKIRPGKLLATALQYGIRTDTAMFTRNTTEVDLRAYHYLNKYSDSDILFRIIRSEYLPEWLPHFSTAFHNLQRCGSGHFTYLEQVSSPDILVVIADFFLKVHGLRYIAVAGVSKGFVTIIFRGNGRELDVLAQDAFGDIGTAGGHKNMARAEFSTEIFSQNSELAEYFVKRSGRKSKAVSNKGHILLENYLLNRLKKSIKRGKKTD